ncbi:hypothetical protein CSUI_005356, partial [Cystoisospora suis]
AVVHTPSPPAGDPQGASETFYSERLRLEKQLQLNRAQKHHYAATLRSATAYWKTFDGYLNRTLRGKRRRRRRHEQSPSGDDAPPLTEAEVEALRQAYERKAPEKFEAIAELKRKIAETDREAQKLQKQIEGLNEAERSGSPGLAPPLPPETSDSQAQSRELLSVHKLAFNAELQRVAELTRRLQGLRAQKRRLGPGALGTASASPHLRRAARPGARRRKESPENTVVGYNYARPRTRS